jgi:hypothetical protein
MFGRVSQQPVVTGSLPHLEGPGTRLSAFPYGIWLVVFGLPGRFFLRFVARLSFIDAREPQICLNVVM